MMVVVAEIGVRLMVETLGLKDIRVMDGRDQRPRLKEMGVRDHGVMRGTGSVVVCSASWL